MPRAYNCRMVAKPCVSLVCGWRASVRAAVGVLWRRLRCGSGTATCGPPTLTVSTQVTVLRSRVTSLRSRVTGYRSQVTQGSRLRDHRVPAGRRAARPSLQGRPTSVHAPTLVSAAPYDHTRLHRCSFASRTRLTVLGLTSHRCQAHSAGLTVTGSGSQRRWAGLAEDGRDRPSDTAAQDRPCHLSTTADGIPPPHAQLTFGVPLQMGTSVTGIVVIVQAALAHLAPGDERGYFWKTCTQLSGSEDTGLLIIKRIHNIKLLR